MRRLPNAAPFPLGLAAAALAAACGDPTAPLPTDGPPRALAYQATSQLAFNQSVRAAGDTVVLSSVDYGSGAPVTVETRRVPSREEWRAFWQAVRAAGVSRWPRECTNRHVADGGGFSFELAWDDARRTGTYYAAAPTPGGACSETSFAAARRFEHAVLTVAGVTLVGTRTAGAARP